MIQLCTDATTVGRPSGDVRTGQYSPRPPRSGRWASGLLCLLLLTRFAGNSAGADESPVGSADESVATTANDTLVIPPEIPADEPIGDTIVGPAVETLLSPEATQFVRGMVLMLMPDSYVDDDEWGSQKQIQSGLNVKRDGLKIHTSRRWKDVNHGLWQRVDATLLAPQDHFQLTIWLLPRIEQDVPRYRIRTSARIRATGRRQRWNFGAKLYSLSADAIADIAFEADVHFRSEVTSAEDGSKLRVLPHIERANLQLNGFSLRRVGHIKGGAVREFGHVIERIMRRAIVKKGDKLAVKTNSKIQKKPERFEVPASIFAVFGQEPPPPPEIATEPTETQQR